MHRSDRVNTVRLLQRSILRQLPSANLPAGWEDLPAVRNGKFWARTQLPILAGPARAFVDGVEILARISAS